MARGLDERISGIDTPWENYAGNRIEEFVKDSLNGKIGALHFDDSMQGSLTIYAFKTVQDRDSWRNHQNVSPVETYQIAVPGRHVHTELTPESNDPISSGAVASKFGEIESQMIASVNVITSDSSAVIHFKNSEGEDVATATLPMLGSGSEPWGEYTKVNITAAVEQSVIKEGATTRLTYRYESVYAGGDREGNAGVPGTIDIVIKRGTTTVFTKQILNQQSGTGGAVELPILAAGNHDIYVTASIHDPITDTDRSRQEYCTLFVSSLSLSSSFSLTDVAADGGIERKAVIPVTVSGSGTKTIKVYIDGRESLQHARSGIQPGTRVEYFDIDLYPLSVGRHSVQLVAVSTVDGVEMLSDSVYIDLYKKGVSEPFVVAMLTRPDGRIFGPSETPAVMCGQYEQCELQYAAYDPDSDYASVEVSVDSVPYQSLQAPRAAQSLSLRFQEQGERRVQIKIAGAANTFATRSLGAQVSASSLDISLVTAGLLHQFKADGRSNSEADPAQWVDTVSGEQMATFTDCDWATSGWQGGALKLMNGAKCELSAKPFASDSKQTGLTIEALVRVSNVSERGAEVIKFVDEVEGKSKGFALTTSDISYRTGTTVEYIDENGHADVRAVQLSANYPAAEARELAQGKGWMHIAFVVSPQNAERLMELYIDGNRAGADEYGNGFSFRQDNPKGITMDSSGADLEVKFIRIFNRALSEDEVLENSIVESGTAAEMAQRWQENKVLDDSSKVDMEKLLAQGKGVMRFVLPAKFDNLFATNRKDRDFKADVWYWPSAEAKAAGAKPFVLRNCYIRIQGTSSTKYPSKNIRIYLNKGEGQVLTIDGEIASGKYSLREGAPAQSVLCAKTDYSDSSMSLNTGGAKMFNDVMIKLGLLTPPQKWQLEHGGEINVRQSIDGWPIDIFAAETEDGENQYYGQYNLNNEKSKSGDIFGMSGVEGFEPEMALALETLNNQEAACLFAPTSDVEGFLEERFDAGMEVNYSANGGDGDVKWSGLEQIEKDSVTDLYTWMRDCLPIGADLGTDDPSRTIDLSTWVSQKFRDEADEHFDINHLCAYYLWTDYFLAVDQRAKNILWRCWGRTKTKGEKQCYIWYATYYDGDTQMGKRNDSFMVYGYDTDRNTWDAQAAKFAFEGNRSWLWNLLLANFPDKLAEVASRLRYVLTNEYVLDMYMNEQMGSWCDRVYNRSGNIKYIYPQFHPVYGPYTWKFIFALQGSAKAQREYMVRNRFAILDAKYCCGEFKNDTIELYLKSDTHANFTLAASEPYAFAHSKRNGPMLGNTGIVQAGEPATLTIAGGGANDPLSIYGASRAAEIDATGACSMLYNMINFNKCVVLRSLNLSVPAGSGASTAWCFDVAGCRQLRRLELRGQTYARTGDINSTEIDLTTATRLGYLDARGVDVPTILLAPGAAIESCYLPANLVTLTLDHLPLLEFGTGLTIEGYSQMRSLSILDCAMMRDSHVMVFNWLNQKEAADALCSLTLTGMQWTGVSVQQMLRIAQLGSHDLQGTVQLASTPTSEQAMQLMEAFGQNCFSQRGRLRFQVEGQSFLIVAPGSVPEGIDPGEPVVARVVPLDFALEDITITATASDSSVSAVVDQNAMTVSISAVENGTARNVAIAATGRKPGYGTVQATATVAITARTYPLAFTMQKPDTFHAGQIANIGLVPSSTAGNGVYRVQWSVTGNDAHLVTLSNMSNEGCSIEVQFGIDIAQFTLAAEVYKTNAAAPYLTVSENIECLGENILMTATTNPEVFAICRAQGWAAHESYMTYEEAAAVTNDQFDVAFKGTNIKRFEELEYFSSVTEIRQDAFRSCQSLERIVIPAHIDRFISYALWGTDNLTYIEIHAKTIENTAARTVNPYNYNAKPRTVVVCSECCDLVGCCSLAFAACETLIIESPIPQIHEKPWGEDNWGYLGWRVKSSKNMYFPANADTSSSYWQLQWIQDRGWTIHYTL